MTICDELEELIPAYVLDAVDPADRARIESHLPRCRRCSQLVESYQPVTDLLAYAAEPAEPRAELKYRVLAATLPQRKIVPAPAPSPLAQFSTGFSSLFRAPALSALALLLLLALGAWNVTLQNQVAQQAAAMQQVTAEMSQQRDFLTALAYSDGQPHHLQGTEVASQAVGRLYSGYDENSFVMITYDMPSLKPSQSYQLWLTDVSGNRTSGGVFTVDAQGRGWLIGHTPKPLSEYKSVGVTVEPLGGSPGPTGAKMLGGSL
jgi:anti-sigma-K factor RskA